MNELAAPPPVPGQHYSLTIATVHPTVTLSEPRTAITTASVALHDGELFLGIAPSTGSEGNSLLGVLGSFVPVSQTDVICAADLDPEKQTSAVTAAETDAVRDASTFFAQLQRKAALDQNPSNVIDEVYDFVDDLLLSRQDLRVRWILRTFAQHTDALPASVFLSLLTITRPWRHLIKTERDILAASFRRQLVRDRGAIEADALVRNLL